jgi:hypothetical protein
MNCGDPGPPDSLLAPSAIIVVEVLSPSSRGIDASITPTGYFRLASVMHCLIFELQRRLVLHYRREDARLTLSFVKDGDLTLDRPGLSTKLDETFS